MSFRKKYGDSILSLISLRKVCDFLNNIRDKSFAIS